LYLVPDDVKRRILRRYRRRSREVVVDERFRGWAWEHPPLDPPYDIYLPLSEIASRYCETMRDIYLRHVEHIRKPTNVKMIEGRLYHQAVTQAFEIAKRILYSEGVLTGNDLTERMNAVRDATLDKMLREVPRPEIVPEKGWDKDACRKNMLWLWNTTASQIAASVDRVLSTQPYIGLDALVNTAVPVVVEQRLDGRNIGLSGHLSADAYGSEGIIMDIKTGRLRRFHRFTTTGYALVIESIHEYPVDVGCIIYCWFDNPERPTVKYDVHSIDEPLRQEFVDLRDDAMRIVYEERDPSLPQHCYEDCPYWEYCH